MKRPNILIIETDQHNPRYLGISGHPVVKMPCMDRLAEAGVRFEAAYCNNPVCVPSRASMWTGKLPETTGYRHNWTPTNMLQDGHVTMAAHFAANGYNTCAIGKTHTISYDQSQGWMQRFFSTADQGYIYEDMPLVGHKIKGESWKRGFDSINIAELWKRAGVGPKDTTLKDAVTTMLVEHYLTNWLTGSWEESPGAKPLFLYVGYESPHYMYNAPVQYFLQYRDQLKLPPEPRACIGLYHPEDIRYLDRYWPEWRKSGYPEEDVLNAIAGYLGMVTFLDGEYQKILHLIERHSNPEDWIIVHTSDHGEMLGERGLWCKVVPYEGSIRVPLTITGKGRIPPGRVVSKPVSLVDLYPTLCDLSGLGRPEQEVDLDGTGFAAYLLGQTEEVEVEKVICQTYQRGSCYDEENWKEGHVLTEVIRKGQWKLICHREDSMVRLYDLDADPEELHDLGQDPEYKQMRDTLLS